MNYFVGIDIGGTNVEIGILKDASLLFTKKV